MSATDIAAGARWSPDIQRQLSETSFGVLCVTSGNQTAPWLVFEAGALAKAVEDTFVCPYLIDLEPAQVQPGPLAQFQSKRANEDGTRDLVRSINRAAKDGALPEDKVERAFAKWWPDLQGRLVGAPAELQQATPRSTSDMVEEILVIARDVQRTARAAPLNVFEPLRAFLHTSTPEQRADVARQIRDALANTADDTLLMPEFWAGFMAAFVDTATQAKVVQYFGGGLPENRGA